MHVFCSDCGQEADVCRRCDKLAVYQNSLCGRCFSWSMPSESMCQGYVEAAASAEKIPFKCSPCRAKKPWRWQDNKEIVDYRYVPMSFSFPVSPTNVIRIPRYRAIGSKPTDPLQRADEARAAYEKELSFSGNVAEALNLYVSFYKNIPPRRPLKAGFVPMSEILQGQPVTGEQFFMSVREEMDSDMDDELSYVGNNPLVMSSRQLRAALDEVDEDRKMHSRRVRYEGWTEENEREMDAMDNWAMRVYTEILRRRSSAAC